MSTNLYQKYALAKKQLEQAKLIEESLREKVIEDLKVNYAKTAEFDFGRFTKTIRKSYKFSGYATPKR